MIRFIWETLKEVRGTFPLLFILLLSAAFELVREPNAVPPTWPDNDPFTYNYFPFSKVELYRDTHLFYAIQHFTFFTFAVYIWWNTRQCHTAKFIFVILSIISVWDYFLFHGEAWFRFEQYDISWDILKVVVFSLAIINEVQTVISRKRLNGVT